MVSAKPVRVFLGLGSNMGYRESNLGMALDSLSLKIKLRTVSAIYDTAPVGNTLQERFLNLVCEAETNFRPFELLTCAKEIEKSLGRKSGPLNSPRPIDIDIVFYGDLMLNTPELVIPHPRIIERAFVLVPMAEIAPDFIHPVLKQKIKDILQKLHYDSHDIVKWENEVRHV